MFVQELPEEKSQLFTSGNLFINSWERRLEQKNPDFDEVMCQMRKS